MKKKKATLKRQVAAPQAALEAISLLLGKNFWDIVDAQHKKDKANGHLPTTSLVYYRPSMLEEACIQSIMRFRKKMIKGTVSDFEATTAILAFEASCLMAHWRLTKGVYVFDDELSKALDEADIDNLPIAALTGLPEYAPFIALDDFYLDETKHLRVHGAWVGYKKPQEADEDSEELTLCCALLHSHDIVYCTELEEGKTVRESIEKAYAHMKDGEIGNSRQLERAVLAVMKRAFYLCSTEPDVNGVRSVSTSVVYGNKEVLHIPSEVNEVKVGYRYGAAIRMWQEKQQKEGKESAVTGLTVAPHVRRAHYHLYWTGKGRKEPRVKWIAPILVGMKDDEEIIPTIRAVKAPPRE